MLRFRGLWLIVASLFLGACSSGKLVKTYEGDAMPDSQVATLTAGENIVLLSVNGQRVPDYLLSSISVNYGLKPGKNVVVFQYESVWAQAKRGEDGRSSEAVESERREVELDVAAGDKLTFRYGTASNIREAQALAATFEAEVTDQHGRVVAASRDVTVAKPTTFAESGGGFTGKATSGLPAIEAIKVLWEDLSADEKKDFLKWAFQ